MLRQMRLTKTEREREVSDLPRLGHQSGSIRMTHCSPPLFPCGWVITLGQLGPLRR